MIAPNSITDWIQAIVMVLTVPALIVGFFKFFIKDRERQREIDSLASLAQSQSEMIKRITEQIGLDKRKHLFQILPFFNILPNDWSSFDNNFDIKITNSGARCKFKGYDIVYNPNVRIYKSQEVDQFIEGQGTLNLFGITDSGIDYLKDALFIVYLLFEDVEGNQYHQILTKQSGGHYLERPIIYTGSIEDSKKRIVSDGPSGI